MEGREDGTSVLLVTANVGSMFENVSWVRVCAAWRSCCCRTFLSVGENAAAGRPLFQPNLSGDRAALASGCLLGYLRPYQFSLLCVHEVGCILLSGEPEFCLESLTAWQGLGCPLVCGLKKSHVAAVVGAFVAWRFSPRKITIGGQHVFCVLVTVRSVTPAQKCFLWLVVQRKVGKSGYTDIMIDILNIAGIFQTSPWPKNHLVWAMSSMSFRSYLRLLAPGQALGIMRELHGQLVAWSTDAKSVFALPVCLARKSSLTSQSHVMWAIMAGVGSELQNFKWHGIQYYKIVL